MGLADLSPLQYRTYVKSLLLSKGYTPHAKQQLLHDSRKRYRVVRCGRRFGKTFFAVNEIIQWALLKQPGTYWFVAPTYRQAKELAWKLFDKYLPKELVAKKNETELIIKLVNGSEIALKGADNPDSLRGVGINGLVMDETAFIDPYAWDTIRPVLSDTGGWAVFISTPKGYNWFHDLYMNAGKEEYRDTWESFHFTSYDNPTIPNYIEELEDAKRTLHADVFDQEYMAEFTARSGKIYDFYREHHVRERENPPSSAAILGSIDFGFAKGHPTAVLWHAVTAESVYTFDGFVEEGLTIDQIVDLMHAQTSGLPIRMVFADSARPDLIKMLQEKGLPVVPAKKDVELGIAKVQEYMKVNPMTNKPRWTIAGHLDRAIQQIENYEWAQAKVDGRYKQVPKKVDDDAPDSLRYFLFTYTDGDNTEEIELPQYEPTFSRTGY